MGANECKFVWHQCFQQQIFSLLLSSESSSKFQFDWIPQIFWDRKVRFFVSSYGHSKMMLHCPFTVVRFRSVTCCIDLSFLFIFWTTPEEVCIRAWERNWQLWLCSLSRQSTQKGIERFSPFGPFIKHPGGANPSRKTQLHVAKKLNLCKTNTGGSRLIRIRRYIIQSPTEIALPSPPILLRLVNANSVISKEFHLALLFQIRREASVQKFLQTKAHFIHQHSAQQPQVNAVSSKWIWKRLLDALTFLCFSTLSTLLYPPMRKLTFIEALSKHYFSKAKNILIATGGIQEGSGPFHVSWKSWYIGYKEVFLICFHKKRNG